MLCTPALNHTSTHSQSSEEEADQGRREALVEAMKESKYGLQNCSEGFLSAFLSSLQGTVRVKAGDCLLNQGSGYSKQVFLIESGTLEILVNGKSMRLLRRGDVLGKHTFVKASFLSRSGSEDKFNSWLMAKDLSGVTVRALSDTSLSCGGVLVLCEVKEMKRDFAEDLFLLEEELARCVCRSTKQREKR
jgi:hypothetical protein